MTRPDRPNRDRLAEALERLVAQGERVENGRRAERARDQLRRALEPAASADREDSPSGKSGKPVKRGRGPDPLPLDRVERLDDLLAKREKAGKPRRGPLTLAAIARASGFTEDRVSQGEKLREAGWDLRRSHPDFSGDRNFVYWPQP